MRLRCAVFIVLLAACGDEPRGAPASSASQDRPLAADFEEVYRIGGIEVEGWDAFTEVADLGFDASGRLYVRDEAGSSTRIVAVDEGGTLAAEFGRMGDGPGELRQVGHMVARPEGGAVVLDEGHRAYLLFGVDGSFERAVRFADSGDSETASADMVRHAREAGALFLTRGNPVVRVSEGEASGSLGDRTIYRVSLDDGEEAATAPFAEGWEPRPERQVNMEAADLSAVFDAIPDAYVHFLPGLPFDVVPGGGVAYSDSSAYEVRIQTDVGPPRVVGRPLHPRPVTKQLQTRARARAMELLDSSSVEPVPSGLGGDVPEAFREQLAAMIEEMVGGMRDMVENASFMPEVPLVRDLRTTWEGAIWVERWGSNPIAQIDLPAGGDRDRQEAEEGWIDILTPGGEYVGTFSLEQTLMPAAFGPGGLVAFVETDELEIPTIVVKRLPAALR